MSTKDPRKLYPQPPYSGKEQTPPGNEEEMSPKVDHGESSYEGTGQLEGRHALITGADSGIGRTVALAFAREGADVAISYLSEEKDARQTERLVTEAGRKAILLPGDIGEPSESKAVAQKAIDALGTIDILVNNAAFSADYEKFEDISDAEFEETYPDGSGIIELRLGGTSELFSKVRILPKGSMEFLRQVSVQVETNGAFIQPTTTRNQWFTEYEVPGNSKLRIVVAPPKGLTSRAAAGAQSSLDS
jgi:hypothetical protein